VARTSTSDADRRHRIPWLEVPPRWLLAFAATLVLEAAALGGLVWWAGWRAIVHAVAVENAWWFAVCAGGQLVAYLGYTLALRRVARAEGGVELDYPVALGVVSVGFSPIFSANAAGGYSVDLATLRAAGLSRRKALTRVLALSALEYAVLAPAVAICGVLLVLHVAGTAEPDVALPWLAVVPGALAFAWFTAPGRAERYRYRPDAGRLRNAFAHAVSALTLLRSLIDPTRHGAALVGAAVYWCGDLLTLWAALQIFEVQLTLPELVVAYGTGWALTRRSLPLGGPGVVEVMLAWVLTWFDARFASAAAAVVAYRLFNFWLANVPAVAVLPFAERLRRRLGRAAVGTG
jgi:uncharacterized membrane protein YbhN (UPF0104 family)